ncbi:MAG: AraC family transcriptional regulator [Sulfurimonas sp.]|nr:AraC family transcriptional regulator [Sulfurimonas sp.]
MNRQIKKVLYYIETHLKDDLDLETLAKVAGYSRYHFCRIFKASVGESVISYYTRLRVEIASLKVMSYNKSIIEVALEAGYETPNGFNKAFKKIFGMTPTTYKSKQMYLLKNFKDNMMQTPKIVQRDETYIVYERETGEYMKSSQIAWTRLSEQLNNLNITLKDQQECVDMKFDSNNRELLGICHDNPSTTAPKNIRYDAAISWSKKEIDFLNEQGFETKNIPAGKYVTVLYKGNNDGNKSLESWTKIYIWCEQNNYQFRDFPPFEKYLNTLEEVSEDELLTEIYVPIK